MGNGHCAWDSHLHQAVDRPLSSVAPPLLRCLDKTGHHLAPAGDADRPCQEQVRTRDRKRTPAKASHYPPPTGETTRLCQSGSDTPGASGQDGSNLEAGAHHSFSQRRISRWHRQGFKLYWKYKSRVTSAKPKISAEIIALIKEMASNNRLWGAERIRGELLKLGLRVCKRTIQKYMRPVRTARPRGQTWSTFLHTHAEQIWACDASPSP